MEDSGPKRVGQRSSLEPALSVLPGLEEQLSGVFDDSLNNIQPHLSFVTNAIMIESDDIERKTDVPAQDTISPFDILTFQNSFYECVEELKIRRVIDDENEEKIKQLVSTQHDQERSIKEELSRNASLKEKHSQEICELKRLEKDRLHRVDAEKSKLTLAVDSLERETKELKDDIRNLQLTKHSLEKTIKDQGQRLKMQGSARSTHLSKMTELGALCKEVQARCHTLAEQLKRLEVNVGESSMLQRQLSFTSEHQTCTAETLRAALKSKTEELVSVRAALDGRPHEASREMAVMSQRLRQAEQQLKQKESAFEDVREQLEEMKKANESSLEALARSQQLSDRHLAAGTQNARQASSMANDLATHKAELAQVKENLQQREEQLRNERDRNQSTCAEWEAKEKLDKSVKQDATHVEVEERSTNTEVDKQTQDAMRGLLEQTAETKSASVCDTDLGPAPTLECRVNAIVSPREEAVTGACPPHGGLKGDRICSQAEQVERAGQVPACARGNRQEIIDPTGDTSQPDNILTGGLESDLKEVRVEDPLALCPPRDRKPQHSEECLPNSTSVSDSFGGGSKGKSPQVDETRKDKGCKVDQPPGRYLGLSDGLISGGQDDRTSKHQPSPEAGISQQVENQEEPALGDKVRGVITQSPESVSQRILSKDTPLSVDGQTPLQDSTADGQEEHPVPALQGVSAMTFLPKDVKKDCPNPVKELYSDNPVLLPHVLPVPKTNFVQNTQDSSVGPKHKTEVTTLFEAATDVTIGSSSDRGLSMLTSPKLEMPKLSSSQLLPASSPHQLTASAHGYPDAFSRNRTRPSYMLPGFSMLSAHWKHGAAAQGAGPPSSIPHETGSTALEGSSPSPRTSQTPALPQGASPMCPREYTLDRHPSAKVQPGSQEWPNFSEEFHTAPNPAALSVEYSAPLQRSGSPGPPPAVSGAKRPAQADAASPLFSDGEDEADDIKSDVASQISRIQTFLRGDRLKRPRRSKSVTKGPSA